MNNISFQKKLVAKCFVGTPQDNKEVAIYHLDETEDVAELQKTRKNPNWKDNYYLQDITFSFYKCDDLDKQKFYTMEDENEDIICVSYLKTGRKKDNELEYIETAPKYATSNKVTRPAKYVGETMLAYIATETKNKRKNLEVPLIANRPTTKNFYFRQCGFKSIGGGAYMDNKDLGVLIKNNERHTGAKIDIIQ